MPGPGPAFPAERLWAANTRGISVGEKKKKALGFQPFVGSLETPLGEGLSEGGSLKRGQGCGAPDSPAVPLQC